MEIFEHQEANLKENRVDIYYNKKDKEILALLDFLEGWQQIVGKEDLNSIVLSPHEIYYFETVDKKCFAYLEEKVYQVSSNLQEIEAKLGRIGFARINKSMIVNLRKVRYLRAGLNMRMTAELLNGEHLVINRSYKIQVSDAIKELYRGLKDEDN